MFRSQLKIAWRNLTANKLYSTINIGGLAIGMAASFLLLIYVSHEFSIDRFNVHKDRLFQVFKNQPSNGELKTKPFTPEPLAPLLKKDFPEIEDVARTNTPEDILISYQNKRLKLNTIAAEPSFLSMFTFHFIEGNPNSALSDEPTLVLTQSGAEALFGKENPIGKVVKLYNEHPLTVSAVIQDNPQHSSFSFKAIISWHTLVTRQPWIKDGGWGNYSYATYVMLKPGTSYPALNAKMENYVSNYDPSNKEIKLFIYPFKRLHLYGDFKNGINSGGRIEHVRLFLFLAVGILIIACINFMNLSTARSQKRAREVGVRKAIGSSRLSLIRQFMTESALMAFIGFLLSLLLLMILLPYFNDMVDFQLSLPYGQPWAWITALGVTLLTGLLAGSYPALYLSSFNPIRVLKDQLVTGKTTIRPRQVLVLVQFTFSICLILSSILIYKQINYIKDRPVGYNRDGLIEMPVEGTMFTKFESFRQEAISAGAIVDGAVTSGTITNNQTSTWGVRWPGQQPGEDKLPIDCIAATYHFMNTYGLELVSGRDFSTSRPADSTGIIINESAVKMMRLESPLGAEITWQGTPRTVIGVARDFVWGSPYEPVKPAIIGFAKDWIGNIGLRLNPDASISNSLTTLKNIYRKFNPEYPFEYTFTDESFSKKFNNEQLLGTISTSFTLLAIIISCLGLFGLASFSAEQRKREMGIRKVLGASTASIWFKLSQEFIKLVLISFALGSAVSWYHLQEWLGHYTYHTSLGISEFAPTLFFSMLICMVAVSWQAIRAALANPVTSLRSE